jgi:spermidine synthase
VGELGELAGRLYSWNTVGSLLGALLGGYLLFFWFDLHEIYRIALASVLIAAVILTARVFAVPRVMSAALAAAGLAGILGMPSWSPEPFSLGLFRMRGPTPQTHAGPEVFFRERARLLEVLFYEDDATNSIAVSRERGGGNAISIVNNGKSDGNLVADYTTMALTGLIPALLSERPQRAFVVGYGTGVTVGELAALPEVEKVVVAEISRGVLRAAPFFDVGNQGASTSSKVQLVRGDAYRVLLRSPGRYDVISSEPSNPWMAGVEMLYSQEFLSAAKARLNPGGVYAQWFHGYETDARTLQTILRTYTTVFDDVAVWYTMGPDLILLGFTDRDADLYARVARRATSRRFGAGLRRSGIDSLPALLAHELVPRGVLERPPAGADIHTLLHPVLSDRAARAFFAGGATHLPSVAMQRLARAGEANSLLRRYTRERNRALTPAELGQVADQLCLSRPDQCAVVLARWMHDHPGSAELAGRVQKARQRMGSQGPLAPSLLRGLASLFGPGYRGQAVPTPKAIARATAAFSRYYYPAIPFDRRSLQAMLERCAQDPAQADACQAELQRTERRLGALGATTPG